MLIAKRLFAIFLYLLYCNVTLATSTYQEGAIYPGINQYPLTISGIILHSECTLNDDRESNINFGNVTIQFIDGIRYSTPVPFNISCPKSYNGEQEVYISATASSFDTKAVQTSNPNVGIRLILNGENIEINKSQNIDWRIENKLNAVPVKKNNVKISAGNFTASATMVLNVR